MQTIVEKIRKEKPAARQKFIAQSFADNEIKLCSCEFATTVW